MSSEPPTIFRKDYQPPSYWVESLRLEFDLHDTATLVHAAIEFFANEDSTSRTLTLDGEELSLKKICIDGRELSSDEYTLADDELTLKDLPTKFRLETWVEINPEENSELSGLYRSSGNFCTQCEAMGFRRITYFLDRPDVMTKFHVTLRANKEQYPVLLSNGNRIASRDLTDGRHEVSWEDPFPKPSYLFALVGGNLKCHSGSFTTMSGRDVQLEIWVEPQDIDKCEHALNSLKKSMRWDEEVFGLEYDLDIYMIVAVSDFNMGAMENKGLNIFNTKYVLARPETATDTDYEMIEAVIAHEYFHNWTGNRVTCRDWFQLTLKEGLTVFRDQQFTADMTSSAVKRIDDVVTLRSRQFPEDAGPMAHPIRPESYISMDNFYTATVYDKGAEIIRMYHTLLGPDGFRKGMDLYFERHDGDAVTCDDFRAAMANANDFDLEQFGNWYSQAGTPELTAKGEWDAEASEYRLHLQQGYPNHEFDVPGTQNRKPLHLPIKVGLLARDGEPITTTVGEEIETKAEHLLELKDAQTTFTFSKVSEEPVPSILRGFSAPVKLSFKRSRADLAFLMTHDPDSFSRWDASQALATSLLVESIEAKIAGRPIHIDPFFIEAFGNLLVDTEIDGSFKSLLMTLPSEAVLAQEMETVDPDAISETRQHMRSQLAGTFRTQLLDLYKSNRRDERYRNDVQSNQRRRLKNTALTYLAAAQDAEVTRILIHQFRSANNMTDQYAAFSLLADSDVPERNEAISAFYEKWKSDPLVIDKWFIAQATSLRSTTVEDVVALSHHEAFSLSNPNRVRSLVSAFGMSNQRHFHRADGLGYEFVADKILELEKLNPQIAARLVTPFNQWKRYDSERQELMTNQLARIQSHPGLSKDVREIVDRALSSC